MRTFNHIGLWILIGVLALFFFLAGVAKISNPSPHAVSFARWGYPPWFLSAVGWAEMIGAIALCIPQVSGLAALWLAVIMIGAFTTHLWFGEFTALPVPLILLGLSAVVGYARRHGLVSFVYGLDHRHR